MATVLVTGGTGVLGSEVAAALLARAATVRIASRRPRPTTDHGTYSWATVDFRTGAGLADAVAGIDAVVHCASATRPGSRSVADEDMTRFLVGALPPQTHLVHISIVGIEAIPLGYYRHKLAAEAVIQESGLPWTILRTTQFHSLVLGFVRGVAAVPGVMPVPAGVRFQPIAPAEVGAALAELAGGAPAGRVPDLGGPEVREFADLARAYLAATRHRRRIVEVRLGGGLMRALRDGANLVPENPGGHETFEEYLQREEGSGRR